jgi:hypothetical protein
MHWWEVRIPTIADDGTTGVQTFTYTDTAMTPADAERRALIDVHSYQAIRHRRGAAVDTAALQVANHNTWP